MEIRFFCPSCESYNRRSAMEGKSECACFECKKVFTFPADAVLRPEGPLNQCLFCGKTYFYHRADFNKGLGCSILIAAIILSPWTYGISLAVAGLIDWWLFKRLQPLVCCYICDTEYRGLTMQAPEFDLHLHEKYRKDRDAWAVSRTSR